MVQVCVNPDNVSGNVGKSFRGNIVANKQLKGQIFNHEGRCYLVMEDNDWNARDLKVKIVDGRKQITTLPLILIQERLGRRQEQGV